MPRNKTTSEKLAGKLISVIQKEFSKEFGEDLSIVEETEEVMSRAHKVLRSVKNNNLHEELGTRSLNEYLGVYWIEKHPDVKEFIELNCRELLGK